jgi:CrcB protein
MMSTIVLVFVGGGLGSVLRLLLAQWLTPVEWDRAGPPFPYGTLAVNLIGCLVIGLVAGWCGRRDWTRSLLLIGVLGGFTTFSTFGLDTARMVLAGHVGRAGVYVVVSVLGGLAATVIAMRYAAPPLD